MTTEVSGSICIGEFLLELPYGDTPNRIGIYRATDGIKNEGGDFDAGELEAIIAEFYEENF